MANRKPTPPDRRRTSERSGERPVGAREPLSVPPRTGERAVGGPRAPLASDPLERVSLATGQIFATRYRIDRFIARGGMGSLYEVVDLAASGATELSFALKVLTPLEDDERAEARFRREAELARSLVGEPFPKLYQYGVEQGMPYMVMELFEGETLASRLRRQRTLSPRDCADLLRQLADGLEFAHAIGIVHRDITPRNLFFAVRVNSPEALKILDFGIARHTVTESELTVPGTMLGSPHYVSPEQAVGTADIDGRTDLWSSAVVLYESLLGRRPFEGDAMTVVRSILCDPPSSPTMFAPRLGERVDSFFARALAKKPDERYETAREMADAFADALREAPDDVLDTPVLEPEAASRSAPPEPDIEKQAEHGTTIMPTAGAPTAQASTLGGEPDRAAAGRQAQQASLLDLIEQSRDGWSPPAPASQQAPVTREHRGPDPMIVGIAVAGSVILGMAIALLYMLA